MLRSLILVPLLLILPTAARSQTPAGKAAPVVFSRDILPVLSENCFRCHGPDDKMRKAKLRLDLREGALRVVAAGKSAASELLQRVCSAEVDRVMPPPKSGRVLTVAQKELLRRW